MPDYEMWAPDDATMTAALSKMALKQTSAKIGNSIFATDYYGKKYIQSGTVLIGGDIVPNWVLQTGVYCNIRWLGPTVIPPLPANSGCTVALQAAPFWRVFAG
jgi:hypothetical protein